jgi:hypothetical protein
MYASTGTNNSFHFLFLSSSLPEKANDSQFFIATFVFRVANGTLPLLGSAQVQQILSEQRPCALTELAFRSWHSKCSGYSSIKYLGGSLVEPDLPMAGSVELQHLYSPQSTASHDLYFHTDTHLTLPVIHQAVLTAGAAEDLGISIRRCTALCSFTVTQAQDAISIVCRLAELDCARRLITHSSLWPCQSGSKA